MPTSTTVKGLNINELTEAQYDAAVLGGVIGPNELSVLTDVSYVEPSDLATVATTGDYNDLINKPTIPAAIQVSSMPVAGVDELDKIYQFVGATDASYTNGYFYKCVSDGQTPATYSWEQTDVMPAGSSLPTQTGHSGEFLTTDGSSASWSNKPLVNMTTQSSGLSLLSQRNSLGVQAIAIGEYETSSTGEYSVTIGSHARAIGKSSVAVGNSVYARKDYEISIGQWNNLNNNTGGKYGITIGCEATINATGAMQFGYGTNTELGTVCFALTADGSTFTNYKLLDSDGTIPTARLTKVNTTITLTSAGWSGGSQTVTVNGVTSTSVVLVAPDPSDTADYVAAGILCISQATNSLTFTCSTTPTADIDVNVVCL